MLKVDAIKRNAFVLFGVLTILMVWTSCLMPLTWDEGNAIIRSEKIGKWVTFFWSCPPGVSSPLDWDVIQKYCEQTTQTEGHPAGYVLLIAAGHGLADAVNLSAICDEKTCCRLGPMLLFCAALTAVYIRIGRTFGQHAALFCVLCILFMPRVFAHAHIAVCDSPLMSCWLLAWAFFEPALKSKRGAVLWGIAIGLGFSMKFPGWIIPIPFLAYAVLELCRRRPMKAITRSFLIGFPTAVFFFYLLNPTLWYTPIDGFIDFMQLNMQRSDLNILTCFLGKMYDMDHPLPWYNTLIWAGITIPVGLLFFLICLAIGSIRHSNSNDVGTLEQNRIILLTLLNFLPLMIIRSIPGMPVHDGVRLFVAAFPFAGILAGLGASLFWGKIKEHNVNHDTSLELKDNTIECARIIPPRYLMVRRIVVLLILFGSGFNLYWYGPQWLSYYNLCIGGLPGAVRSGMEATYYWDSFDDETMTWLNDHLDRQAPHAISTDQVLFHCCFPQMLEMLHRWKKIDSGTVLSSIITDRSQWLVIQRREGALRELDKKLIKESKPVYRKVIPRVGPGPWNLSEVPLLEIYDMRDFIAIVKSLESDKKNTEPVQWTPW